VEKPDAGNYVNLLKPFEFSLHRREDKMQKVGLHFEPIDHAKDFEEVYRITLNNVRILFEERARITREGGNMWDQVDVLPLFSCTLADCITKRKDYTAGGARYRDEHFYCFGVLFKRLTVVGVAIEIERTFVCGKGVHLDLSHKLFTCAVHLALPLFPP
jgi:hypothetical protein